MSKPVYTISVKNRWFGWTTHRVTRHVFNPEALWLELSLADGSTLTVPRADERPFMIHRDYTDTKGQLDELKLVAERQLGELRTEVLAQAQAAARAAVAAASPPSTHPLRQAANAYQIPPLNGIAPQ